MTDTLKTFYTSYADKITEKRLESPYAVRRFAHEKQYAAVLRYIEPGMRVLDAGCGEGVLSIMMAQKGAFVVGTDLSEPNILAAKRFAQDKNVTVEFQLADAEKLPFPDNSFDIVVSSHVLEHLTDFDQGLREVMRVTKKRAVVAIPTILNLCSFVQVGHGWFYLKGLRSYLALPYGMLRTVYALITGKEGVDEGYVGTDMPHIFRFPYILKQKARRMGFSVVEYRASSICIPYFESFLWIGIFLDTYSTRRILRNFGYGTTYVLEKEVTNDSVSI